MMDRQSATARRLRRSALVLPLALFFGCAGEPGDSAEGTPAVPDAPQDEAPRVAMAPTGESELPSAILGEGGALEGVDLRYFDQDSATTGYLAVPGGEGPFPALVIVHEWDGLKDRVRQLADDLAAEGYVTLAADLFQGRTGENREENMALVREVQENQATMIANLNAAVETLRARDDVTGRVGTMGWCFGGGVALSYGLDGIEHEATAIFYGSLVTDPEELADISHEVYGTFAELDGGIPPEQVETFVAALREAGVENDVHVYDAVNHGFWLRVDQDPNTRTAPALDAWQRLKAYLDRTLGNQGQM